MLWTSDSLLSCWDGRRLRYVRYRYAAVVAFQQQRQDLYKSSSDASNVKGQTSTVGTLRLRLRSSLSVTRIHHAQLNEYCKSCRHHRNASLCKNCQKGVDSTGGTLCRIQAHVGLGKILRTNQSVESRMSSLVSSTSCQYDMSYVPTCRQTTGRAS
jgi:hypothetical protein